MNSLAHISPKMERAFLYDEIENKNTSPASAKRTCLALRHQVSQFLSYFDFIRFCRYQAIIDTKKEKENLEKNERNLNRLLTARFGTSLASNVKHITNLSDHASTTNEEFVLSHGLNFCTPPKYI